MSQQGTTGSGNCRYKGSNIRIILTLHSDGVPVRELLKTSAHTLRRQVALWMRVSKPSSALSGFKSGCGPSGVSSCFCQPPRTEPWASAYSRTCFAVRLGWEASPAFFLASLESVEGAGAETMSVV